MGCKRREWGVTNNEGVGSHEQGGTEGRGESRTRREGRECRRREGTRREVQKEGVMQKEWGVPQEDPPRLNNLLYRPILHPHLTPSGAEAMFP